MFIITARWHDVGLQESTLSEFMLSEHLSVRVRIVLLVLNKMTVEHK